MVRLKVSAEALTANQLGPVSTTVRHGPEQAIDAPSAIEAVSNAGLDLELRIAARHDRPHPADIGDDPGKHGFRRLSVSLVAFQEIGAKLLHAGQMEARRGREAIEPEQGRGGQPVCANQHRCTEPGNSVDQPRLKERRRHTAATLDQEPGDAT